ncbi:hypothetical protein PHYPSEUDO_003456 [Phytophthora pseudosyringae]|uniref:LicD family n=1 Tax=Phytophthora pseudosyringae TaxID=221518 RepID=A0A8T1VQK6_9STRA|nr:hypothetical protein PHYPSEUDO_003456 [Phytophthora pseudosyringae]
MKATVAVLPAGFVAEDQRPGHGVNAVFPTASSKCLLPDKRQWSKPRAKLMAFFAFFVAVGAFSLTAEMQLLPRWASFEVQCSPATLTIGSIINYHSAKRFDTMMKEMKTPDPPTFRNDHKELCSDHHSKERRSQYCLPITSQNDPIFCAGANSIDLFVRQSPLTLCRASVMHLLLSDVFEELQANSHVNFIAEDELVNVTSINYDGNITIGGALDVALQRKGYHLFHDNSDWRVCVAPTHPLAANLYNPEQAIQDKYNGLFLELVPRQENFTAEAASIGAARTKEIPESMAPTTSKTMTEAPTIAKNGCTPNMVNISAGGSSDKFTSMLKSSGPLAPPRFHGEHEVLCDSEHRKRRAFGYCLPISGRNETPRCANADRMDILLRQSPGKQCLASVLHMLLKDVYEELKAVEFAPILTFGTLLGAVRDGGIIPFTEDVDIAYDGEIVDGGDLDDRLWRKGYHLFEFSVWRVCVAPTHPLASQLYDPALRIVDDFTIPYVDLYAMEQQFGMSWSMQELKARRLPNDRVVPFSHVSINGEQFDTVHDPNFLLRSEYGADFMTPKPRN